MVAAGYDVPYAQFSRPFQFLRLFLWEASCANVACPSAMQDGAARLLQLHLSSSSLSDEERKVFQNSFDHLVSRDPKYAWTSGQWMTERPGGSDVSLTETTAHLDSTTNQKLLASKTENIPLGPWSINGFKWFSSATDSRMTVLLARTPSGRLSTFLAPMQKHDPLATTSTGLPREDGQVLNGVRIQRLKNKLGTQSLPTAELVLEDMRGWIIGQEGRGIQEISTVLTITRVHSAVAAVGYLGRGLGIARAYSRVREVGAGRGARVKLSENPLHMRTLAGATAEYRGLMLLTFFASYVLGVSEHSSSSLQGDLSQTLTALTPGPEHVAALLRILTPLTKAYVCKSSVALLFSCMECLGGVGYLLNDEQEYLNIARLYRDCCVLPIWEGTTDVLSTDFIRALKHPSSGREALDGLRSFVEKAVGGEHSTFAKPAGWDPVLEWTTLTSHISQTSQAELMGDARDLLWKTADLMISCLLFVDAARDGDAVAKDIFRRFVENKDVVDRQAKQSATEQLKLDRAVVYGGSLEQPVSRL